MKSRILLYVFCALTCLLNGSDSYVMSSYSCVSMQLDSLLVHALNENFSLSIKYDSFLFDLHECIMVASKLGDPWGLWSSSYSNTGIYKQSFWFHFCIWISEHCLRGEVLDKFTCQFCALAKGFFFSFFFWNPLLVFGAILTILVLTGDEEWLYCNCNSLPVVMFIFSGT